MDDKKRSDCYNLQLEFKGEPEIVGCSKGDDRIELEWKEREKCVEWCTQTCQNRGFMQRISSKKIWIRG